MRKIVSGFEADDAMTQTCTSSKLKLCLAWAEV